MALIGNRSVLNKSPGRFLAGTVASGDRSAFNKHGMVRSAGFAKLSAWPSGHLSPSAWVLPRLGGDMSSRNTTELRVTTAASGAMGVNGGGTSAMSFTAEATGGLIASALGSATFTVTAAGSALATINGVGAATFTLSTSGTLGALAWGAGATSLQVAATMSSYAVGHMSGDTAVAGEITNESVAAAVWVSPTRTLTSGGGGGGSAPTAEENANAVWQHSFVAKLLTVAKYLGLR